MAYVIYQSDGTSSKKKKFCSNVILNETVCSDVQDIDVD